MHAVSLLDLKAMTVKAIDDGVISARIADSTHIVSLRKTIVSYVGL